MRISPLGIFGVRLAAADLAACARADASLTHPHPACQDSNAVYTAAVAFAIRTGAPPGGFTIARSKCSKGTAFFRWPRRCRSPSPGLLQTQIGRNLAAGGLPGHLREDVSA